MLEMPVDAAVVYLFESPKPDDVVIKEECGAAVDDAECIWLDFDLYVDFNSNCNSSHLTVSSAAFW
jgi:hypothetical protein